MIASAEAKVKSGRCSLEVGDHNQQGTEFGDMAQGERVAQVRNDRQPIVQSIRVEERGQGRRRRQCGKPDRSAHAASLSQILRTTDRRVHTHRGHADEVSSMQIGTARASHREP